MKKRLMFIAAAAVAAACVFALFGCKKETGELEKFKEKISYRQEMLYTASNDDFAVNLSGGVSEQPFIIDGKAGETKKWATLRLAPKKAAADKAYAYKIVGDKGELTGEFKKEMLGTAYSAEIKDVSVFGAPQKLIVTSDGAESVFELENRMTGIDADKALEIAINEFREQIDASEEGVNREIYIKYINDRHNSESPYCWYVSFIAGNEDFWAVLLSPADGKVISKRV